ncbi:MAG: aspartate aminotransferase family protein [Candidatus Omnitrophica bacterium]|nr:aspartate aminotransferase family protein [Candidatus Omnitrophota bacterium]
MIPGSASKKLLKQLRQYESPHVTYGDADFPVFIRSAKGCRVTDVDGNSYLDLTAFFAVCGLGHGAPVVRRAAEAVLKRGWHAMGDVHPHELKLEAARAVASVLPKPLKQVWFSCNGSDAVETALKTAYLYTGKPGVLAFEGSYHGLGYGALQVTSRAFFREPFAGQGGAFGEFAPFPMEGAVTRAEADRQLSAIRKRLMSASPRRIGAVIVEPIQGRAGVRPIDPYFLTKLARIVRAAKALLIFDEIYSGFCRTGKWFAFEHYGVTPDLICLGKGMSNGFPISACVSSSKIFAAWGPSPGEARHTSTFLGHPMGCAMTSATIGHLKLGQWDVRARETGEYFRRQLCQLVLKKPRAAAGVRGRGLMLGLVLKQPGAAAQLMKQCLKKGIILLPSGEKSNIVSFSPSFIISKAQIKTAVDQIISLI